MTMSAYSPKSQETIQAFQSLAPDEQIQVLLELEAIVRKQLIAQSRQKPQTQLEQQPEQLHNVMEFKGMAKGLWSDISVEEYLEKERASWRKREQGS